MKSVLYIASVLSLLLVTASIDSVPDPPAVTPHAASVKACCLRDFSDGFRGQRLACDSDCISRTVPIHRVSLEDATRPRHSTDWITLAAYAADSSPPVL
jgi:hypothetical protein